MQGSIILDKRSEPQPDLLLLRPRADFYASADARPEDVLLVVEVGDSSLAYDRNRKAPLYASHGIPEYWLVDVRGDAVIVLRNPGPEGYQTELRVRGDGSLGLLAFPDLRFIAREVLG